MVSFVHCCFQVINILSYTAALDAHPLKLLYILYICSVKIGHNVHHMHYFCTTTNYYCKYHRNITVLMHG